MASLPTNTSNWIREPSGGNISPWEPHATYSKFYVVQYNDALYRANSTFTEGDTFSGDQNWTLLNRNVTSGVTSVNGRTGAVVIQSGDLPPDIVGLATGAEQVSHKDVASGYAGLDSSAKLRTSEIPPSVEFVTNKDSANGYAGLDSSGKLKLTEVPPSIELNTNKDVASGYAGLDSGTKLKVSEFPSTVEFNTNKDQASGYAGLDSGGKLKISEFPPTVVTSSSPIIASRYLSPVGGGADDSANLIDALTNYAPFAYPIIALGPGTFNWLNAVPALARNTPVRIVGAGIGKTIIKLSTGAPRFLDFNKIADFDIFSYIELCDFTVDCNNVGGRHHVVIGTFVNVSQTTKISVNNLFVRRVQTINVPTQAPTVQGVAPANHRLNIWIAPFVDSPVWNSGTTYSIGSLVIYNGLTYNSLVNSNTNHQPDISPTQWTAIARCTLNNHVYEDLDLQGGNMGVVVAGVANTGNQAAATFDQLHFTRVRHDSLLLYSGTSANGYGPGFASNIQVGSRAPGGSVVIEDCYGANSSDVGIEIDNASDLTISNTTIVDAFTMQYLVRNFVPPLYDVQAQTAVLDNCKARVVNQALSRNNSYFSTGYWLSNASLPSQYGKITLQNCTYENNTSQLVFSTSSGVPSYGAAIQAEGPIYAIDIIGFEVIANGLAIAAPADNQQPQVININTSGGTKVNIERPRQRIAGSVIAGGAGTVSLRYLTIKGAGSGNSVDFVVNNFELEAAITGLASGYGIIPGGTQTAAGGTVSGLIRGFRPSKIGDVFSLYNAIFVPSTSVASLSRLVIEKSDFVNLSGSATDVNIDVTQRAFVQYDRWNRWKNIPKPRAEPVVAPYDPRQINAATALAANTMYGCRVTVPQAGILHDLAVYIGTTTDASGHLRGAVYDTGELSSGNRSRLSADSGSIAAGSASNWQVLFDPAVAVYEGQELDFVIQSDSTVLTLGKFGGYNANVYSLPTNYHYSPGGASPKLSWNYAIGSYAALPSTIAEANCSVVVSPFCVVCRITQ